MRGFLAHVARWPLLFGSVICLVGGLLVADASGAYELIVGVLLTLGAILMGAWLWALATHTNPAARPAPPEETTADTPIPPGS